MPCFLPTTETVPYKLSVSSRGPSVVKSPVSFPEDIKSVPNGHPQTVKLEESAKVPSSSESEADQKSQFVDHAISFSNSTTIVSISNHATWCS